MATIKVQVSKVGDPKIEAEGFTGTPCKDATKFLEDRLGGSAAVEEKPEMYMETETETESETI